MVSWFLLFFTVTKLIITDSIGMAVTAVKNTLVLPLPSLTVARLTEDIASGSIQICGYEAVLFHVGTHDIPAPAMGSLLPIAAVLQNFKILLSVVRESNPSCLVVLSAILPRPVDHLHSWYRVRQVNHGLRTLCFGHDKVIFNPSYKFFVSHGLPLPQLFSSLDSLHLSTPGVSRLRQAFQQAMSPVNLVKANHCHRHRSS